MKKILDKTMCEIWKKHRNEILKKVYDHASLLQGAGRSQSAAGDECERHIFLLSCPCWQLIFWRIFSLSGVDVADQAKKLSNIKIPKKFKAFVPSSSASTSVLNKLAVSVPTKKSTDSALSSAVKSEEQLQQIRLRILEDERNYEHARQMAHARSQSLTVDWNDPHVFLDGPPVGQVEEDVVVTGKCGLRREIIRGFDSFVTLFCQDHYSPAKTTNVPGADHILAQNLKRRGSSSTQPIETIQPTGDRQNTRLSFSLQNK